MPLIYGLLALALGVSLIFLCWSPAFAAAIQVLGVFFLLIFGLIWSVVGYSELKASRELEAAKRDGDSVAPSTDTADAAE